MRKGVPYPSERICSLKERIAEIWDKLDEKIHSINGVQGDGAGDLKIESGDAAVVIDNDQIGHRIEVSLDSSKLPAASVSSVNGQTGAVQLSGSDLSGITPGHSVNDDIAALENADTAMQGSISSEAAARADADSALQTNIDSANAAIGALQNMQADYVKKAGAAQTVTSQITVPTTATGVRDTQIANGTRIQNDLAAYEPMVRDTGNKKIAGVKQFTAFNERISSASGVQFTADNLYMKIGTITRQLNAKLTITIGGGYTATCDIIEAMIHTFNMSRHYGTYAAKHYNTASGVKLYIAANTGTDSFDIWIKMPSAVLTWIMVEAHVIAYGNSVTNDTAITPGDMVPAPDPSASYSQFSEVVMS